MGEVAVPTPEERGRRRALALAIVDAVRNDEECPLRMMRRDLDGDDAVRDAAFGLAQEVEMLFDALMTTTKTDREVPFDEPGCGMRCPTCGGIGRVESER